MNYKPRNAGVEIIVAVFTSIIKFVKKLLMKKILLLFLTVTVMFISCKKKETSNQAKTKYDLLVNKKWKINAISGYDNGVYIPDGYTSSSDYAKDNYFYFYDNLRYEENEGVLRAPRSTEQIIDQGTWQLTTSDRFINFTSDNPNDDEIPFKILELTETTLVVEADNSQFNVLAKYSFIVIP